MKKAAEARRLFRPGILALLCLAALLGWAVNACYLNVGYLRLICPAGFLEIAAVSRSIPWHLLPGFVLVVLIILLAGRVWCAWFCQASFLSEKLGVLTKGKSPELCPPPKPKKNRMVIGRGDAAAIVAGLFAGILIFGFPVLCLICPVGIISRNIISLFASMELRFDLLLLAVPVVFGLFIDTRKAPLCPAGLARTVISTPNRTLVPEADPQLCINCGRCSSVCPAGLTPNVHQDLSACIKCLSCIDSCPTGAMELNRHCGRCTGNSTE